jgi:hypothetical protein
MPDPTPATPYPTVIPTVPATPAPATGGVIVPSPGASTIPVEDPVVKEWQNYLKTAPLGISYAGPVDGKYNPELLTAAKALEAKLKEQGKQTSIVSSDKITASSAQVKTEVDQLAAAQKSAPPNIKVWKEYAKNHGYTGNVDSPDIDANFKQTMLNLEGKLSHDVPSITGMLWQGNAPNPNLTPAQYEEALKLLQTAKAKAKKASVYEFVEKPNRFVAFTKMAQPTLDELGPPVEPSDLGSAGKRILTQDDSQQYNGDPDTDQNRPVHSEIPGAEKKPEDENEAEKTPSDGGRANQRMKELTNLMEQAKKSCMILSLWGHTICNSS